MATGDLCSAAQVADNVGVDQADTANMARISRMVTASSYMMLGGMNRPKLGDPNWVEKRDGNDRRELCLRFWPVNQVKSVYVNNAEIPASDGVTSGWVCDGYLVSLIGCYRFNKGFQNVQITYDYGWSTVPADMETACIELASQKYKRRKHIDVDSENMGGPASQGVVYSKNEWPTEVGNIIKRYRIEMPIF